MRTAVPIDLYCYADFDYTVWRCRRITWCSGGGGVVAFYRRSRPLMFAHDTYSGTNGRLTPFVRIDSNAISLNLGSSAVARKLEVGMLLHLRIKIRVLRNDIAKNRQKNALITSFPHSAFYTPFRMCIYFPHSTFPHFTDTRFSRFCPIS